MKFETIKTYILFILVGISFILTFSLWSYESKDDYLVSAPLVDEFNIGGKALSKKQLIAPSSVIFEKYNHYYGYSHPLEGQALYQDMQSWVLYDFRQTEANGRPNENYQIEIIFPIEIPMSTIPRLFELNDNEDIMPTWSFQRIYITFETNRTLTMQFLSIDGRQQVKYDVNNPAKYDMVWSQMEDLDGLVEYMVFNDIGNPIYIPKNGLTMPQKRINVNSVDPILLVNALFTDPSVVRRNVSNGESYYQDARRTMRISKDGRSMEFTNPQQVNYDPVTPMALLDRSIKNINEFKGWINDYRLESIDTSENAIRYQMHMDGYPIYHGVLNVIEQQWRNNELFQYSSPLIQFNESFEEDSVELVSGLEIITLLNNSQDYEIDKIMDIRIGYRINESGITLEPVWYMKYNDNWIAIPLDENSEQSKGVS